MMNDSADRTSPSQLPPLDERAGDVNIPETVPTPLEGNLRRSNDQKSMGVGKGGKRKRKCQCGCKQPATGGNGMTAWATYECAIRIAEMRREKKERAEFLNRKEKAKRPSELKKEAQAAFNAYIRFRDISAGHPCICCGEPFEPMKPGGSIDAGHYLSRGNAPHLRFDERNVHAQRKNCNRPGGTTRAEFRVGMIARIGLETVEALEADQTERRYRADDYREIRDKYRKKLIELKKTYKARTIIGR